MHATCQRSNGVQRLCVTHHASDMRRRDVLAGGAAAGSPELPRCGRKLPGGYRQSPRGTLTVPHALVLHLSFSCSCTAKAPYLCLASRLNIIGTGLDRKDSRCRHGCRRSIHTHGDHQGAPGRYERCYASKWWAPCEPICVKIAANSSVPFEAFITARHVPKAACSARHCE